MTESTEPTNNNSNYFNNYDYLNFSFKQIPNFKKCKTFGGKNGISFETNPERYNELNEEINNDPELQNQKILRGNPSNIVINESTLHHFKFTICSDYIEYLSGTLETKDAIENAIQLSSDFVFITQENFDSDVTLFKRGFKTNYSDWTAYTNHITSNTYFNMLFDFYKLGLIEEYIIFYSEPIKTSNNRYIHPLNSSIDQDQYDPDIHPFKQENVKFQNIFHKLNILITVKGYKDIDNILEKINEEKTILYDSRNGIYKKELEEFIEPDPEPKKGIFGKVNAFLNSDM